MIGGADAARPVPMQPTPPPFRTHKLLVKSEWGELVCKELSYMGQRIIKMTTRG
jgi:hypothetical protein